MATAEGHWTHPGAAEGEGLSSKVSEGEGAITVGDLVEAGLEAAVAARTVEAVAERGRTGDRGEGGGPGWVEDGVGLVVAPVAGGALEPEDVTAGIENHVEVPGRGADTDAGEVLATALGEAGDDAAAEARGRGVGEGSEGGDTGGIAMEA